MEGLAIIEQALEIADKSVMRWFRRWSDTVHRISNISGDWRGRKSTVASTASASKPEVSDYVDVINPATGEVRARTRLPRGGQQRRRRRRRQLLGLAAGPVQERIQLLFRLRDLLKANIAEISRAITDGERQDLRRKPKPRWCALSKTWKWPAECRC